MTREQTTDLLQERMDEDYFNEMVDNMVSGPVIVFLLQRIQVFEELQRWIGPENPEKARSNNADTLVALYGKTKSLNGFYYSLNGDQAKLDIQFFFPDRILKLIQTLWIHFQHQNMQNYFWMTPCILRYYKV